jgi:glycosyltransferase involved in cell wall biosynthesis
MDICSDQTYKDNGIENQIDDVLNRYLFSKQIFTTESILKGLTNQFVIDKTIDQIKLQPSGKLKLKHIIERYLIKNNISSILTQSDLETVDAILKQSNISLRQLIYLKNNLLESISKDSLINIFKDLLINQPQLDPIIKIYDRLDDQKKINLVDELFGPIETISGQCPLVAIIPSYNNKNTFKNTLKSVFCQNYHNYRVIFIDDQSEHNEIDLIKSFIDDNAYSMKTIIVSQIVRQRQAAGRYIGYHMSYDDEIVLFLDGDDRLMDQNVMDTISTTYNNNNVVLTYGSFVDLLHNKINSIVKGGEEFPPGIIDNKNYRYYRYISCHLRTGYAKLFKNIKLYDLLDTYGQFYHILTDYAEMIPVHEMTTIDKNDLVNPGNKIVKYFEVIKKPLYIYNKDNSLKYLTSYARQNEPDNQYYKQYRIDAAERIRSSKKYKFILKKREKIKPSFSDPTPHTEYYSNIMINYDLDVLIICECESDDRKLLDILHTDKFVYLSGKVVNHSSSMCPIMRASIHQSIQSDDLENIKNSYDCIVRKRNNIQSDQKIIIGMI